MCCARSDTNGKYSVPNVCQCSIATEHSTSEDSTHGLLRRDKSSKQTPLINMLMFYYTTRREQTV